jgi:putative flippase GtrA
MTIRSEIALLPKFRWLVCQVIDPTFARFALVGFSNFIVSYGVFRAALAAPLAFPMRTSAAQLMSYALATLWSLYWNRRFTFRSSGPLMKQARRFIILQVSLALTSAALIGLAVDHFGISPSVAWFAVMSVVTIVNFLLVKWWVFKE